MSVTNRLKPQSFQGLCPLVSRRDVAPGPHLLIVSLQLDHTLVGGLLLSSCPTNIHHTLAMPLSNSNDHIYDLFKQNQIYNKAHCTLITIWKSFLMSLSVGKYNVKLTVTEFEQMLQNELIHQCKI